MGCGRCINPECQVLRLLRFHVRYGDIGIGFAVHGAKLKCHVGGSRKGRIQTAKVRQVQGVDVFLVGHDDHIGTHGHELLGFIVQAHIHRIAVDHKALSVHIAKAILGNQAHGSRGGCIHTPLASGGQQGIVAARHVFHVVEFAVCDSQIVIVALEGVQHLSAAARRFQGGIFHNFLLKTGSGSS